MNIKWSFKFCFLLARFQPFPAASSPPSLHSPPFYTHQSRWMEITHFRSLLPLSFVNSLLTVAFLQAESLRNEQMEGWQSRSSNNDAGRQVVVINTCQKNGCKWGSRIQTVSLLYRGGTPVEDVESESKHLRLDMCVQMFDMCLMLYPAWLTESSINICYWQLTL